MLFNKLSININKNNKIEKKFTFLSNYVDLIYLEFLEFFYNLVSFPTAITNPKILLFVIVHPDQTVHSIVIGSSRILFSSSL